MTTVPRPRRPSRASLLASGLFCGGMISLCLPWGLSLLKEPQPTRIPLAVTPTSLVSRPAVELPTSNLQGEAAVRCNLKLLHAGFAQLQETRNFAGTFRKQERVDGILDEGSVIQVVSRHDPMSFYMKWLEGDVGRELLYVEGENDGEMLVRLGGIRGRLLPVFKIDPNGVAAREKTRHHISHMSLLNFTQSVITHCEEDLDRLPGVQCELLVEGHGEGKDWIRVSTEYDSPDVCEEYRKTIHYIDRETILPLKIKTYRWPQEHQTLAADELDRETLVEDYEYSDLQFDLALTDEDFSRENPKYTFVKRR